MTYARMLPKPAIRYPHVPLMQLLVIGLPVGGLLYVLAQASVPVAAVAYAIGFILLAAMNPPIALMIVFASASFTQDLAAGGPFRMSIGEINLALVFPICVFQCVAGGRPIRVGPMLIPIILYLGVCTYSSIMHWDPNALTALLQTGVYLVGAIVVFSSYLQRPFEMHLALDAAVYVGVFLSICGLATNLTFPDFHKNAWGGLISSITLIAVELWFAASTKKRKTWILIALMLCTSVLILSLSRGAWLGTAAGVLILMAMRRQFKMLFRLALIMLPLLVLIWWELPAESREYAMGLSADRANISARLITIGYCKETFLSSPIFGVGLALRKEIDATNVILVTLAESGVIGLLAFMALHLVYFVTAWQTQKFVPRNHPLYSLLAVGPALLAGRLMHGMVDHYWSRGAILQAWGAVGMTLCVAQAIRASGGKPIAAPGMRRRGGIRSRFGMRHGRGPGGAGGGTYPMPSPR